MSVIYVKEQGSIVQKRSKRILITKNKQTLLEVPIDGIESIAIIGNVQITTQALYALMQAGIDINYFTFSGKYVGASHAERSKNIFLRLAQYDTYCNQEKRLEIAKLIVKNKIQNQIYIIQRYPWESEEKEWSEVLQGIQEMRDKVESAKSSSELMGIEGKSSNLYFKMYGKCLSVNFYLLGEIEDRRKTPLMCFLALDIRF